MCVGEPANVIYQQLVIKFKLASYEEPLRLGVSKSHHKNTETKSEGKQAPKIGVVSA